MRHSSFKAGGWACVLTIAIASHAQRVPSIYGYDLNADPDRVHSRFQRDPHRRQTGILAGLFAAAKGLPNGKWKRLGWWAMPRWILLSAVMLAALPCLTEERPEYGVRTDGQRVTSLGGPGTKAIALFFVASDCPISNRSFPEMKRLREEFSSRGVRFWFVYPNVGERPEQVRAHQSSYDAGGEALLEATAALVRMAGARVTPEVSILVPDGGSRWRRVYTGRIDDRFVHIGQERPQPTEHFAERALASVLQGRRVEAATGVPVGCGIINPGVSPGR